MYNEQNLQGRDHVSGWSSLAGKNAENVQEMARVKNENVDQRNPRRTLHPL